MKNIIKKIISPLIITVSILAAASWISSTNWQNKKIEQSKCTNPQDSKIQVETAIASKHKLQDWLYAEGISQPLRKAHLTFEVEGKVNYIAQNLLKEGCKITIPKSKKVLLARLDNRDYLEEVNKSKAILIQAQRNIDIYKALLQQHKSQRKFTKTRLNRYKKLLNSKTISQQKFDEIKIEYEISCATVLSTQAKLDYATAELTSARNSLSQNKRELERTCIFAPFSGTIARVNISIGSYVNHDILNNSSNSQMYATYPITIIDKSIFRTDIEIPFHELQAITTHSQAKIIQEKNENSNIKKQWLNTKIHSISPALSPNTHTIRIILHTLFSTVNLTAGQTTRIKILRKEKEALAIPINALLYNSNNCQVFILDEKSNRVKLTNVKTGIRQDNLIEIISGLKENQKVITTGRQRLLDNDIVKTIKKAKRKYARK